MKKQIYISSEQFKDAIERLWETCEQNGASLTLAPVHKKIFVHQGPGEPLVEINVLDITDDYDLPKAVFES